MSEIRVIHPVIHELVRRDIPGRPGRLFVVGGAVRDILRGAPFEDIDLCVVGDLSDIIDMFGNAEAIHADAPVFGVHLDGVHLEVALARAERSSGPLSEDFDFELVGSIEEDLERRDVTINAMAVDLHDGRLVDPFGGASDLDNHRLHPVSEAFSESAERVGRVAALVAITGFRPSNLLLNVCADMVDDFAASSAEQKFRQFLGKALVRGRFFRDMFDFLENIGALSVFPALAAMRACEQHPAHHPEGDVLVHSALVMEAMAIRLGRAVSKEEKERRLVLMGAALMHDMGKPAVSVIDEDGVIRSPGHEHEHDAMLGFMDQVHFPHKLRRKVRVLVDLHMRREMPSPKAKRRVLVRLHDAGLVAHDLMVLQLADGAGRGPDARRAPSEDVLALLAFERDFLAKVEKLPDRRLLSGHDVMRLGVPQGPEVGRLLKMVDAAFMEGVISSVEEAEELVLREILF